MEGVYEAVVDRLAMLGYTVTDADETGLKYTIRKCEAELLANINHRKLPPPLFYTLVDMVAGHFLFDKKAAGGLDGLEGFDFNAPAKSITEGDISVTFATVTVRQGVLNPANGRTEPVEKVTASGLPCRISHQTVKTTEPTEEAALVAQTVTLYIDPSVDIPEGSKITVTQNGVTRDYERSGKPAVYTCHQEVPLELFKEWA